MYVYMYVCIYIFIYGYVNDRTFIHKKLISRSAHTVSF